MTATAEAQAPEAQQEAALPEFASVVLTIDHIATQTKAPDHTIRKWVTSTQSLFDSMLALMEYYGESHLLARESTLELFTVAKAEANPVFVYHTPQNVQIVASLETHNLIALHLGGGSLLVATEKLEQIVANMAAQQITQQGGVVPLSLFSLNFNDAEEEAAKA